MRMVGTPVPPGATRRFELRLPDCEVLSDPCSRSVTLKLSLQVDGKYGAFELPPVNYTLMPDPNATFQGSGLHDNLPLFVVQGEAAGAVLQRDLEIAFQFSAPQQRHETPPPECAMIANIFARQGLHAEWRFVDDREGFQVRILLHKQAPGPAVDAALGGVRRAFGSAPASCRLSSFPMPQTSMPSCRPQGTTRKLGQIASSLLRRRPSEAGLHAAAFGFSRNENGRGRSKGIWPAVRAVRAGRLVANRRSERDANGSHRLPSRYGRLCRNLDD